MFQLLAYSAFFPHPFPNPDVCLNLSSEFQCPDNTTIFNSTTSFLEYLRTQQDNCSCYIINSEETPLEISTSLLNIEGLYLQGPPNSFVNFIQDSNTTRHIHVRNLTASIVDNFTDKSFRVNYYFTNSSVKLNSTESTAFNFTGFHIINGNFEVVESTNTIILDDLSLFDSLFTISSDVTVNQFSLTGEESSLNNPRSTLKAHSAHFSDITSSSLFDNFKGSLSINHVHVLRSVINFPTIRTEGEVIFHLLFTLNASDPLCYPSVSTSYVYKSFTVIYEYEGFFIPPTSVLQDLIGNTRTIFSISSTQTDPIHIKNGCSQEVFSLDSGFLKIEPQTNSIDFTLLLDPNLYERTVCIHPDDNDNCNLSNHSINVSEAATFAETVENHTHVVHFIIAAEITGDNFISLNFSQLRHSKLDVHLTLKNDSISNPHPSIALKYNPNHSNHVHDLIISNHSEFSLTFIPSSSNHSSSPFNSLILNSKVQFSDQNNISMNHTFIIIPISLYTEFNYDAPELNGTKVLGFSHVGTIEHIVYFSDHLELRNHHHNFSLTSNEVEKFVIADQEHAESTHRLRLQVSSGQVIPESLCLRYTTLRILRGESLFRRHRFRNIEPDVNILFESYFTNESSVISIVAPTNMPRLAIEGIPMNESQTLIPIEFPHSVEDLLYIGDAMHMNASRYIFTPLHLHSFSVMSRNTQHNGVEYRIPNITIAAMGGHVSYFDMNIDGLQNTKVLVSHIGVHNDLMLQHDLHFGNVKIEKPSSGNKSLIKTTAGIHETSECDMVGLNVELYENHHSKAKYSLKDMRKVITPEIKVFMIGKFSYEEPVPLLVNVKEDSTSPVLGNVTKLVIEYMSDNQPGFYLTKYKPPSPTPTPTIEPSKKPFVKTTGFYLLMGGVGVLVIGAVVALVIIITKRKKATEVMSTNSNTLL